jgi:nucleoside-diphosphate-sugar epimerase
MKIMVLGAGGFVGNHVVRRLKSLGHTVTGVDLKYPDFSTSLADDFIIGDLRKPGIAYDVLGGGFDQVFQFAADMGGAGYIFTGENDATVMYNSASINLNVLDAVRRHGLSNILYTSSACIYPEHNQQDPNNPRCDENSAYPASPDSEYGWEKLFSERLYAAYERNFGIKVHVTRFHNIFGEEGTWTGGKEKAPAAICRKIAEAEDGGTIEIWGDGQQTRSFLYIDECVEGVIRLMNSAFSGPVNMGSEEMVTINQLVEMITKISGKKINVKHIDGPTGVRGRNSDNRLIKEKLGWQPSQPLLTGIEKTYRWIEQQVKEKVLGVGC